MTNRTWNLWGSALSTHAKSVAMIALDWDRAEVLYAFLLWTVEQWAIHGYDLKYEKLDNIPDVIASVYRVMSTTEELRKAFARIDEIPEEASRPG